MNIMFNKYFWKNLWYTQVSSRINPRQKWLIKKIPRTWSDADHLIELCVFESLIYWWTQDNGEESCRYQFETQDHHVEDSFRKNAKDVYDRLLAAYQWASEGRVKAQKDYETALEQNFGKATDLQSDRLRRLEIVNNMENEIIEKDTYFLTEIVKLRRFMWT